MFNLIDVHDVNIRDIGFITTIPVSCTIIGLMIASFLADYLRSNKIIEPTLVNSLSHYLCKLDWKIVILGS